MNEEYFTNVLTIGVEASVVKSTKLMELQKSGDHTLKYWTRKYLPLFFFLDLMLRYDYKAGSFEDDLLMTYCDKILELSYL